MYKEKVIAVLIPAFNEEKLIGESIKVPDYVDKIIVINDASTDRTKEIVIDCMKNNEKIVLLDHKKNQGIGGSIITGCKWARDNNIDIAVGTAGDAQMDSNDMYKLLDVIVNDQVHFSKGNRLYFGNIREEMPKLRYFGNQILSLLTKISSGYWHVADPQSGYVAISKEVLDRIDWDKLYKRYGFYNDLLVRLNIENFRVREVPIRGIYGIGEKSGIKVRRFIFTTSWLLYKKFLFRLKEKYIIRDFHPLVFFYLLGGFFWVCTIGLGIRALYMLYINGQLPPINALAALFSFMSASLFTLFAMWFDMDHNKDLK